MVAETSCFSCHSQYLGPNNYSHIHFVSLAFIWLWLRCLCYPWGVAKIQSSSLVRWLVENRLKSLGLTSLKCSYSKTDWHHKLHQFWSLSTWTSVTEINWPCACLSALNSKPHTPAYTTYIYVFMYVRAYTLIMLKSNVVLCDIFCSSV